MAHILVIDDDQMVRFTVDVILRNQGHTVALAENGMQGIKMQSEHGYDLIITDIIMPEKEGLETLRELKANFQDLPVIVFSGGGRLGRADFLEAASKLGADATLAKPFKEDQLVECVESCL